MMPYSPTIWKTGDIVTATKLNKIENGIQDCQSPFVWFIDTVTVDGDIETHNLNCSPQDAIDIWKSDLIPMVYTIYDFPDNENKFYNYPWIYCLQCGLRPDGTVFDFGMYDVSQLTTTNIEYLLTGYDDPIGFLMDYSDNPPSMLPIDDSNSGSGIAR